MWSIDHELEVWFERVEDDRNDRFGGSRDNGESGPMMTNELAEERRRQ